MPLGSTRQREIGRSSAGDKIFKYESVMEIDGFVATYNSFVNR